MLAHSHFESALPYEQFLNKYGQGGDQARWDQARANVVLTSEFQDVLSQFTRELHVLVLAGAWCGDCASQCPVFERFAEVAPSLRIRYLDRDDAPEVAAELAINGGQRVPVVVFFSEDGYEIARYGERTLTAYRKAGHRLTGREAADGGSVTGDWLREFERSQWIARLSPRLRKLHRD